MDNAIEVRGLAKRFDDVQAVAGVDFDVREGELFGLLGPNGAGKTTTINGKGGRGSGLLLVSCPNPPPRLRALARPTYAAALSSSASSADE